MQAVMEKSKMTNIITIAYIGSYKFSGICFKDNKEKGV
jgi:hypothetical protein